MRQERGKRRQDERYTRARAAILQEYGATFGCEWDLTPWGERWPDVLSRAKEVDGYYNEAEALLEGIVGAFSGAVAFLQGRGLDPFGSAEPLDLSELHGHTLPEALLLLEICGEDGVFREAQNVLQRLATDHARQLERGAESMAQLAEDDVPVFVSYVDGHGIFGTDRSLRVAEYRVPRTGASVRLLVPGLAGRPPRSLTADDKWRRTYLAEFLSMVTRVQAAPDGTPRDVAAYNDRAIASVVLLCGGIDRYSLKELAKPGAVVNAERKAVALARRRRTFSEQVRRETEASAHDATVSASGAATVLPTVPPSQPPPRIKSAEAYRTARGALEREYRDIFGREWDEPPWGRSPERGRWGDIIPKALEQDRAYIACMDHIDSVIRSLDCSRKFLLRRGLDVEAPADDAFDSMLVVGKTAPENALYRAFTVNDAVMARAHGRLRALLTRLKTEWNIGLVDSDYGQRPQRSGFSTVKNTVIPVRGLLYHEITDTRDGAVTWNGWSPGIYAAPPDSLRMDTHEWRRWYIATVLEAFDRTLRQTSVQRPKGLLEVDTESPPVVKDRTVAIISLLAGGLEMYSVAELQRLPNVINAERKAVALARKRARIALAGHWKEPAMP